MQAERERQITVDHLTDIDRLVNESLEMLSRFPDLSAKILPLMEDYLVALRSRDNTPADLLRMDREHEQRLINDYAEEVKEKIRGEESETAEVYVHMHQREHLPPERERERQEEKQQRLEERKQAEATTEATTKEEEEQEEQEEQEEEQEKTKFESSQMNQIHEDDDEQKTLKIEVHATATHHHEQLRPVVAHAQSHEFSHDMAVSQL